jgi:hypothetical protein
MATSSTFLRPDTSRNGSATGTSVGVDAEPVGAGDSLGVGEATGRAPPRVTATTTTPNTSAAITTRVRSHHRVGRGAARKSADTAGAGL